MLQDDRTKAEKMVGLLGIDGYMQKELAANPPPAMRPNAEAPSPLSMLDQMDERHGKLNSRLGLFSHLYNGGTRADYGDADMLAEQKINTLQPLVDGLSSDDSQVRMRSMLGLSQADVSDDMIAMMAPDLAASAVEPDYEKIEINGDYYYTDKNDPTAAPIPVNMADGTQASKSVDADTRKTSGWFKRAVPALENMHKLEDRGVALPREALLLTQQAQDADGFFDVFAYNGLLNDLNLTKQQKQYLRNAQDLAMIQLRKESGAAIGVQEMFNELNQNVMLTDMSDQGYLDQRTRRANKYRGLSDGLAGSVVRGFKEDKLFERLDTLRSSSTRHTGPYDYTGLSNTDFEDIYERMDAGTVFIGPDGEEYQK